MTIHLWMLDGVELRLGHGPVRVTGRQQRTVLAVLGLHANQPVPHSLLAARVWGEQDPPADPRASLRGTVAELRTALARQPDSSVQIVTTEWSCMLVAAEGSVDVQVWRRLRREAGRAVQEHRPEEAALLLDRALSLWRVPERPGPDLGLDAWPEMAELVEERLTAVEDRVDLELRLGRSADVVDELRSLVDQEPLRERRCLLLMRALSDQRRTAEALRAYAQTAAVLADGWGVDPGRELQELRDAVTVSGGTGAPAQVRALGVLLFRCGRLPGADGDPEQLARALDAFVDHVTVHALRAGGWVVPLEGSAVLVGFASAGCTLPAVRCAQATGDTVRTALPGYDADSLDLRAVVALGEVSGGTVDRLGGGWVLEGDAIDACARLLPLARPGAVVLDAAAARAAGDELDTEPVADPGALGAVAAR